MSAERGRPRRPRSPGLAARYGLADSEQFVMVPEQLLRVARERGIEPADFAALTAILFRWRPEKGNALPFSAGELAKLLPFSRSYAYEVLQRLAKAGLVTIAAEPGRTSSLDVTPLLDAMRGHRLVALPKDEPPPASADQVAAHLAKIRDALPGLTPKPATVRPAVQLQAQPNCPVGRTVEEPTVRPGVTTVRPAEQHCPAERTNCTAGQTVAQNTYNGAASLGADATLARTRGRVRVAESDAAHAPAVGSRSAAPRAPRVPSQHELLQQLHRLEQLDPPHLRSPRYTPPPA